MAARLTDKQKKQIIADYVKLDSYNAVAKKHGVSVETVKRWVLRSEKTVKEKIAKKEAQNTADILAHMESQRETVNQIIDTYLARLLDPEVIAKATPSQLTTALGTLIDKFTMPGVTKPGAKREDDPLTKALKEEAERLNNAD